MNDVKTSVAVFNLLLKHFSLEELRTLCLYLGVDYDSVEGEAKPGKARELVIYMMRRGRLDEMIETMQEMRPDVQFGDPGGTADLQTDELETAETTRLAGDVTELLAAFLNPSADAGLPADRQDRAQKTYEMILLLSQLDEDDYMAQTLNRFAQNPDKRQAVFQSTLQELMEENLFFSRTLAELTKANEGDEVGKTVFKTEISGGQVGQVINVDKLEGGLNISSG